MNVQRFKIRHLIDGDNALDWPRDLRKGPDVVLATDYDALTARVAELEAKLDQAQHAYTVTAMELDRLKRPGDKISIALPAADGEKP